MSIRDSIYSVAADYPAYRLKRTVDKEDSTYSRVVNEIPGEIKGIVAGKGEFVVQGSTGQGNITAAPWVAVFDPLITTSATDGYYVVYLFSTKLERIYLSLGIGVEQFEDYYGRNEKMYQKVQKAAETLADIISASARVVYPEEGKLIYGKTDLNATAKTKLHRGYECGNIVAIEYSLADLPSDDVLSHDLQQFVSLYSELSSNPLTPNTEQLVDVSVEPEKDPIINEVFFEPREIKKSKGGASSGKFPRRSRESIKIGRRGEEIVFHHEKDKLIKEGKHELAEKVDWPASRGEYPGFDILSYTPEGEKKCIEVKSSKSSGINTVEITANEWKVATTPIHSANYYLYIVTDVFKNPKIEVLHNPANAEEMKQIQVAPAVWKIDLHGEE